MKAAKVEWTIPQIKGKTRVFDPSMKLEIKMVLPICPQLLTVNQPLHSVVQAQGTQVLRAAQVEAKLV
jgi:hypothetical protein